MDGRILAFSGHLKDHPCCVLAADAKFLEDIWKKQGRGARPCEGHRVYWSASREAVKIGVKYTGMDRHLSTRDGKC